MVPIFFSQIVTVTTESLDDVSVIVFLINMETLALSPVFFIFMMRITEAKLMAERLMFLVVGIIILIGLNELSLFHSSSLSLY